MVSERKESMANREGKKETERRGPDKAFARRFSIGIVLKLVVVIISLVFFISLLGYVLYNNVYDLIVQELGKNAVDLATSVSRFIEEDVESFIALASVTDYENEEFDTEYYERMQQVFQDIRESTGVSFIFAEKMLSSEEIAYIFDGEPSDSGLFSPIGSVDQMGELELRVFKEGIAEATGVVDWQDWGKFVTGYCPITADSGEVVGLAGVDFSIEYIGTLLNRVRIFVIITFATIILLSVIPACKMLRDRAIALNIDFMTGLHNRRYFEFVLKSCVSHARKSNKPLSLMILDVDMLKVINDRHGHSIGDAVLKSVSERIRSSTRNTDICCRIGGDEFAVILPNAGTDKAEIVGKRILESSSVADVMKEGDSEVALDETLSIGVAEFTSDMKLQDLKEAADSAMYDAKSKGRNTVAVSKPS